MFGYIYLTKNLINGKIYIGQHKTHLKEIDKKYFGSGIHLLRAIKIYGQENFSCEILEWCETKEELDTKEKYWINFYDSTDKKIGYNISEGGTGGFTMDFSGENNPMYGVHRYGEDNPNFGNNWSESSRNQMSQTIAQNGGHIGEKNPMYGKHHSKEAKEKMKQSKLDENGEYKYKKEKSPNFGKHKNHPCFGLFWWCDGVHKPIKAREQPSPNHYRGRK